MLLENVYWYVAKGAICGLNQEDRKYLGPFKCSGLSWHVICVHTRPDWHTPLRPYFGWTPDLAICPRAVQLQISLATVLLKHNTSVKDLDLIKEVKKSSEWADYNECG